MVADASQARLGKTRSSRWDWITGEIIVLAEQARLARIPRTKPLEAGKASNREPFEGTTILTGRLLRKRLRRAAASGDPRNLVAAGRPKRARRHLNEVEASFQTKAKDYVVGRNTSRNSSIMQRPRTPPSHQRIPSSILG